MMHEGKSELIEASKQALLYRDAQQIGKVTGTRLYIKRRDRTDAALYGYGTSAVTC